MAEQADFYFEKEIVGDDDSANEFSHFANGDFSETVERKVPASPDPEMHGCRIRLPLDGNL